tara:strand:+ start:1157 stop:1789 length:633 start_codon:yes stop_codon:yes gene_type:complete
MSKENLLNESTIRRFMKLSGQEALTSPFVERLSEGEEKDEKEVEIEERQKYGGNMGDEPAQRDYMGEAEEDVAVGDEEVEELEDVEAEAEPDMDVDVEVDVEPAVAAAVEDIVGNLLASMEAVLATAGLGDLLDVEADAEDAGGVDVEADIEADVAVDDDAIVAVGAEEEEEMLEPLEEVKVVDDQELINEVAKKVTARLVRTLASQKKS